MALSTITYGQHLRARDLDDVTDAEWNTHHRLAQRTPEEDNQHPRQLVAAPSGTTTPAPLPRSASTAESGQATTSPATTATYDDISNTPHDLDVEQLLHTGDERELWHIHGERTLRQHAITKLHNHGTDNTHAQHFLAELPDVTALQALHANRRLVDLLTGRRWIAIQHAREDNATWSDVGKALDMTEHHVREWYCHKIQAQERYLPRPPRHGPSPRRPRRRHRTMPRAFATPTPAAAPNSTNPPRFVTRTMVPTLVISSSPRPTGVRSCPSRSTALTYSWIFVKTRPAIGSRIEPNTVITI